MTAEEVTKLIKAAREWDAPMVNRHSVSALDTVRRLAVALERSTAETRDSEYTPDEVKQSIFYDLTNIPKDAPTSWLVEASEVMAERYTFRSRRSVSSVVAEDPKPFVMRDLTNRASGLWPKESPAEDTKPEVVLITHPHDGHAEGETCIECHGVTPKAGA